MIRTNILILLLISIAYNSYSQHSNFFTYISGEYADGIDTTKDGGYIVFGRTGYNSNGSNFILTKLNKDGIIEWQYLNNQFNGAFGDNMISKVIQDFDGGYIGIGVIDNVAPPYGNNSLIVKLDSLGNLIWNKQFDLGEGEGFGTINFDTDNNYYAHPQLYPKGNTAATIVLSNSLLNMNLRLSL